MAKKSQSRDRQVRELEAEQAGPARAGTILEFDPDAPASSRAAVQSIEASASADTIIPHEDLFTARDELEKRLGAFSANASRVAPMSASAAPPVGTAGRENILGFGVGLKYASDSLTAELSVKVYVREKLPLSRVASAAQIPPELDGLATDVEAIGEVLLHSYARRFPRPVRCGVSVSNINLNGSGTLGCLVVLQNNKLCFLSNNHVLANENAAEIGDEIIQPGNAEPAPAPDQMIGVLENFVPIAAAGNLVDAAVAWTSFSRVSPRHVTYEVNPSPLGAAIGMSVLKNGRTSQSTVGMVTDLGVNISVPYDPFPAGAEMRNQIGIRGVNGAFSKRGDSGSLIVTAGSKQPVALLFAGTNDNSITFANPIAAVMAALSIQRFVGPNEA